MSAQLPHTTLWEKLAYPRLCGLVAQQPSRLSQAMHNAGFQALGLPFTYVACPTTDTALALQAVRGLGFRGLSLTIPHKEAAIPLVDELSPQAKEVGAINTVINYGDTLFGENTDVYGIVAALQETAFTPAPAIILGAGGAARAAIVALRSLGIERCYLLNRTGERSAALAAEYKLESLSFAELPRLLEECGLVINATPLAPEDCSGYPFTLAGLSPRHTAFDMVTKDTAMLEAARRAGAAIVPGIRMLLHQAVKQFELFTEQRVPLEVLETALLAEYSCQHAPS